jgi:hypothetical protein
MSEVSREYYGSYRVDDEDQLQPSDTLDGRGSPTFSTKATRPQRSGRVVRASAGPRRRRCGVRPWRRTDVGIDGGAATAEEAAIHVVEEETVELDEVT